MADEELSAEGSSGGSKTKIILFVLLGVLLAGGSAGAALFFSGAFDSKPEPGGTAKAETEEIKEAVYVSLDPSFTVNFQEEGAHRFLQISLQAMTRDPEIENHIVRHAPMIRNRLVLLFGTKKAEELATREGKEKLQAEALQALQSILEKEAGDKGVEAVYFTSFVMQ